MTWCYYLVKASSSSASRLTILAPGTYPYPIFVGPVHDYADDYRRIMHCHIAFHASEGLALQVNERQAEANRIFPNVTIGPGGPAYADAHRDASRLCKRWSGFQRDCTRHWPGYNDTLNCWPACNSSKTEDMPFACPLFNNPLPNHVFQDDSGI